MSFSISQSTLCSRALRSSIPSLSPLLTRASYFCWAACASARSCAIAASALASRARCCARFFSAVSRIFESSERSQSRFSISPRTSSREASPVFSRARSYSEDVVASSAGRPPLRALASASASTIVPLRSCPKVAAFPSKGTTAEVSSASGVGSALVFRATSTKTSESVPIVHRSTARNGKSEKASSAAARERDEDIGELKSEFEGRLKAKGKWKEG